MTQVQKFLDKNYDQVRQDVLDLFIQSKNKVRRDKHLQINILPFFNLCEHEQFR